MGDEERLLFQVHVMPYRRRLKPISDACLLPRILLFKTGDLDFWITESSLLGISHSWCDGLVRRVVHKILGKVEERIAISERNPVTQEASIIFFQKKSFFHQVQKGMIRQN